MGIIILCILLFSHYKNYKLKVFYLVGVAFLFLIILNIYAKLVSAGVIIKLLKVKNK
jgi:hypothetical protein